MTFIAPGSPAAPPARFFVAQRRLPRSLDPRRPADEHGARLAFGGDHAPAAAILTGNPIEHLARIALG